MRFYPTIFKIVFVPMDAELAHRCGYLAINSLRRLGLSRLFAPRLAPDSALAREVMGLKFPSPFGLAAGFDKEGKAIEALMDLGFGHIEVGTITAMGQPGNPKPRLFRLLADRAVLNRMGFNNDGAAAVANRLAQARKRLVQSYASSTAVRPIIGVNIGKTKAVELADAVADYRASTRLLAPHADYLAVNVSSPNTPGLRSLQAIESLEPLLRAVRDEADRAVKDRRLPLLVKIAPDLADEDITSLAHLARDLGLDGIIATNTTIARSGLGLLTDQQKLADLGDGGISGKPLRKRSLEITRLLRQLVGDRLAIISVGGVFSAQDVRQSLAAGADLVQGYTGFLYEGPLWAARINKELAQGDVD